MGGEKGEFLPWFGNENLHNHYEKHYWASSEIYKKYNRTAI